jgi:hypothetical protein
MGAWGVAVFSDDDAADIRNDYRDYIGDGLQGPEATDRILASYRGQVEDSVLWIALAATQVRCGRLEERVKSEALRVIDGGTDLEHWEEDPKLKIKRAAVLQKLKEQIVGPQQTPTRISQRYRSEAAWAVGELVGYRLTSGNFAVFRVIGHHTDQGGTSDIWEVLDWCAPALPSEKEASKLNILQERDSPKWSNPQIMPGETSKRQIPHKRLVTMSVKSKPMQAPGRFSVVMWKFLDLILERDYGLK